MRRVERHAANVRNRCRSALWHLSCFKNLEPRVHRCHYFRRSDTCGPYNTLSVRKSHDDACFEQEVQAITSILSDHRRSHVFTRLELMWNFVYLLPQTHYFDGDTMMGLPLFASPITKKKKLCGTATTLCLVLKRCGNAWWCSEHTPCIDHRDRMNIFHNI